MEPALRWRLRPPPLTIYSARFLLGWVAREAMVPPAAPKRTRSSVLLAVALTSRRLPHRPRSCCHHAFCLLDRLMKKGASSLRLRYGPWLARRWTAPRRPLPRSMLEILYFGLLRLWRQSQFLTIPSDLRRSALAKTPPTQSSPAPAKRPTADTQIDNAKTKQKEVKGPSELASSSDLTSDPVKQYNSKRSRFSLEPQRGAAS